MSRAANPASALDRLLQPGRAQQGFLEILVMDLTRHELRQVILLLLECLPPCERSDLLKIVAEIAGVKPFNEWKRRRCR